MNDERLAEWADSLSADEMKALIVATIGRLIEIEEINFPSDAISPYWDGDGEPVVDGQDCYKD